MKISVHYILIFLLCLEIDSIAQNFTPLIISSQQETMYFADLLDDKILTLNHFDSHFRVSKELIYDSLLIALPSVNGLFSSLILYAVSYTHLTLPTTPYV